MAGWRGVFLLSEGGCLDFYRRMKREGGKNKPPKAVGKMMPGRAARKATSLWGLMFPLLPKQELALAKCQGWPGAVGPVATG